MARTVQQIAADAHRQLIHDDNELALEMHNILKGLSSTVSFYTGKSSAAEFHKRKYVVIPYNKSRYQAAYMYMYFPFLCHSVKVGLDEFHLNRAFWFENYDKGEQLNLNVCSIGGGPGTDVLGFYRYMRSFKESNDARKLVLNATIIDKYYEWEDAWNAIANQNPDEAASIHLNGYIGYDISKPARPLVRRSVSEANVILLFKFVSAIAALPIFEQNLTDLLRNASPGSYLFFGDNSDDRLIPTFRSIAQNAGFKNVKPEIQHQVITIPDDGALNELGGRYHQNHQNNEEMYFMLLRKQQPPV